MDVKFFVLFLFGVGAVLGQDGRLPKSPCPSIFEYVLSDDGREWMGHIQVDILPSYQMPLKLSVEMIIPAYVEGVYAGKLSMTDNKDVIAQKIYRGEPVRINYQVLFPVPSPLPVVKTISMNQDVLCTGPAAVDKTYTSIRLQHSMFAVTPLDSVGVRPSGDDFGFTGGSNRPPNPFFPQKTKAPVTPPHIFTAITTTTQRSTTRLAAWPVPPATATSRPMKPAIDVSQKAQQNQLNPDNCGNSLNANFLVMNGVEPKRGDWPWVTALFMLNSTGNFVFHCSGTLINHKHVVTAAHCIKYRDRLELTTDSLVVYLGKYNIQQVVEKDSVYSELERIHLHPDYDSNKYDADLAVLELKTTVTYNKYIQPICMWDFSPTLESIVGKLGTVVGWGRDENGNDLTATPRMVRVPVVSQGDCLWSQADFALFTSSRTLCAGSKNGSGPCNGDSGGGLVIPMKNELGMRWYLRGVVSLSLLDKSLYTCDLNQFVVYTDVAQFKDWLLQFINY